MTTRSRSTRSQSQSGVSQPIPTLMIWLSEQYKLESNAIYTNVNKLYKRFNDEDAFASYFFERSEWDSISSEPLDWNYDFIRFVIKIVVDKTGLKNPIVKTFLDDKTDKMLHMLGISRYNKPSGDHYRILTGYGTDY